MAALIIVLFVAGLALLVVGIAFYARLWTTMGMHRMAMHALHQHLAEQRVPRAPAAPVPPPPPAPNPDTTDWNSQSAQQKRHGPHTRWNTRGSGE